jgi:hypothetical protein
MFPRNNRLVDYSPKCDVHSSNVISMSRKITRLAKKLVSGRPISFGYMAARWAGSGSVSRIYNVHQDPCDRCLVFYEHAKQSKIPSMHDLVNRNSGSDARQIFEGNRSLSVFGLCNKSFGNAMVNVFGKLSHPTRKLLEMFFWPI